MEIIQISPSSITRQKLAELPISFSKKASTAQSNQNIDSLDDDSIKLFQTKLSEFEKQFTYPLGNKSFRIDHGKNYFSFFKRLGKVYFYIILSNDNIIATVSSILRNVKFEKEGPFHKMWYICDLKIDKKHRGIFLIQKILRHTLENHLNISKLGYAVSMNPKGRKMNIVAQLATRLSLIPAKIEDTLYIYSLSYSGVLQHSSLIKDHLGSFLFLSLSTRKKLIYTDSNNEILLLHFTFMRNKDLLNNISKFNIDKNIYFNKPQKEHIHMFCLPKKHKFVSILNSKNILPMSSATILSYKVNYDVDWSFIETSDI